jgi:hypothetical protein
VKEIVDFKGARPYYRPDASGVDILIKDKGEALTFTWIVADSIEDLMIKIKRDHQNEQRFVVRKEAGVLNALVNKITTNFKAAVIDGIEVELSHIAKLAREYVSTIPSAASSLLTSLPEDLVQNLGLSLIDDCTISIDKYAKSKEFYRHLDESTSSDKIMTLYHGTSKSSFLSILRQGFAVSSDGMLGRGLYLGEKNKAFTFAAGERGWLRTSPSNRKTCRKSASRKMHRQLQSIVSDVTDTLKFHHVVFECDVIFKNLIYDCMSTDTDKYFRYEEADLKDTDFDIASKRANNIEYVVRDPTRCLATKIHVIA